MKKGKDLPFIFTIIAKYQNWIVFNMFYFIMVYVQDLYLDRYSSWYDFGTPNIFIHIYLATYAM